MSKSVADLIKEQKENFGTLENKFSDFEIGTKVQIITPCQDFRFFKGIETGKVIKNSGKYLGIIVELDSDFINPNYDGITWNFAPDDLFILSDDEKYNKFLNWFISNEKQFSNHQFDEKQIAYSAYLFGLSNKA